MNATSTGAAEESDSFASFQCRQGFAVRATLLRLTWHAVFIEIYSPATVLQLSEVLNDFKVNLQGRPIYSGKGTVRSVVSTGRGMTCEVGLERCCFVSETPGQNGISSAGSDGFPAFLRQWQKVYRIVPEYKLVVTDMQSLLSDLENWLDHKQILIRTSQPAEHWVCAERELIHGLVQSAGPVLDVLFERFEMAARSVEEHLESAHRLFCRRQLHPLLMSSPFMHRIYQKPLGYAGDYEMVNMILRDPCEGESLLARLLNVYILSQAPAEGHRNRVARLTEKLVEETLRVQQAGKTARILNVGCGPAKEVQDFLAHQLADDAEFTLLDFNEETIQYTETVLGRIKAGKRRTTVIKCVRNSVYNLLKKPFKWSGQGAQFDFIYCAGLFDYLNDRVCKELMAILYSRLAPGGLLLATNVEECNPIRKIMDHMFEWHLIYRNRQTLWALKPDEAPVEAVSIVAEPAVNNIFIQVRKPRFE